MIEEREMVADVSYTPIAMCHIVTRLLEECSAITDYRILRDHLPRRLTHLLKCRAVIFYQIVGETLQFVAGSYDEKPGWSSALLSLAHMTPLRMNSDTSEVRAYTLQRTIRVPSLAPALLALPLMHRQRVSGVMVVLRNGDDIHTYAPSWSDEEIQVVEGVAGVVALLLENTRLLERDRERIHEVAFLKNLTMQLNDALYDTPRLHSVILQRVREVTGVDLCDLVEPAPAQHNTSWISSAMRASLFAHFQQHPSSLPLCLERTSNAGFINRTGDTANVRSLQECMNELPQNVKSFLALPLIRPPYDRRVMARRGTRTGQEVRGGQNAEQELPGIIIAASYRALRLRRDETALLQVISSQAGVALEHMRLVADVVEARNEARKLLHRVLDDQRFKELVFESIPSGLITIDMRGRVTTCNRAVAAILGYQPREVIGQSLYTLLTSTSESIDVQTDMPGGVQEDTKDVLDRPEAQVRGTRIFSSASTLRAVMLRTPGETPQHGILVTQDCRGQEIVLDMDILPLRNDRGVQVGAVVTFSDMTSIRRLEEEKRRLDRLATLGEMAANVAHEVRNPLASIKVSMQMLMDDLEDNRARHHASGESQEELHTPSDWIQESTSVVLKEVERLDALVRDLLLFARPRQLHRVPYSLPRICDHVLHVMEAQCQEAHVSVCRQYDAVPLTMVDTGQVEQVLFNVFTNALQAMPEGGTITIACRCYTPSHMGMLQGRALDERNLSQQASQWLELRVTDTGVGIAEEQVEHIFQPFFTTKAHGIGLGLSISRRLLEDHGGSLRVESRLGMGTTISLRFPIYTAQGTEGEEQEHAGEDL